MPSNFKVIKNLEDYNDEYSKISSFSYRNYKRLLVVFIFIYISLIVIYVARLLMKRKKIRVMDSHKMDIRRSNVNRHVDDKLLSIAQ